MEVDGYVYEPSTTPGKKLDALVYVPDAFESKYHLIRVPFGDSRYQHYYDRSGLLDPRMNHHDAKRRRNYLRRSARIRDKNGRLTAGDTTSANFHARRVLW